MALWLPLVLVGLVASSQLVTNPEDLSKRFAQAQRLLATGDFAGARQVYESVLVVPDGALDYGGASYSESFSRIYLSSGPRSWLDQQLTGSLFVEILANLRPVIVPFAPRELGIAVDVLFSRVD